jgi:hypothetical protein
MYLEHDREREKASASSNKMNTSTQQTSQYINTIKFYLNKIIISGMMLTYYSILNVHSIQKFTC